jgi:pimeloyl-ACP methyl ester carboxylesterase
VTTTIAASQHQAKEDAMTITEATTRTLDVPGATIAYDVRPAGSTGHRPLFILGSPMAASGFQTLAGHFANRTVITYDPRGAERSTKDDPTTESTPQQHADDIHRVIQSVGLGPVDVFASSGGAVNALALVAAHPDDVHTLVAHEPPLAAILPDSANAKAAIRSIGEAYQSGGFGPGMAQFIVMVGNKGEFPDDIAQRPAADPTMFGMPALDDGNRTDVLLAQNLFTSTNYQPDFDALRAASTQIVLAAGIESEGEMANRGAHAVAEKLGQEPVVFPSGHGGFLGGEYGQSGEPDAFAAKLHEILD